MRVLLFVLLLPILGCGNVAWFLGGYAVGLTSVGNNSVPPEVTVNVEIENVTEHEGATGSPDDEQGGRSETRPPSNRPTQQGTPPGQQHFDDVPPGHNSGNADGGDAGDNQDDGDDDGVQEGSVILCHRPSCPEPPHEGSQRELEVNESAVEAHLRHGDTLGACE